MLSIWNPSKNRKFKLAVSYLYPWQVNDIKKNIAMQYSNLQPDILNPDNLDRIVQED